MRFPLLTRLASFALLFAASAANAEVPTLPDIPKEGLKAEVKEPVVIKVAFKAEADIGYQTTFQGQKGTFFFEGNPAKKGERQFIFWASKAGTYHVVFWTKGETEGTVATIVVGTGSTDPIVDPKLKGKGPVKLVLFVTDTASPPLTNGHVTAVKNSLKLSLQGTGIEFAGVDKDNKGADGKPGEFASYIESCKGQFPQFFLLDKDKKIIEQGSLEKVKANDIAEKINTINKNPGGN